VKNRPQPEPPKQDIGPRINRYRNSAFLFAFQTSAALRHRPCSVNVVLPYPSVIKECSATRRVPQQRTHVVVPSVLKRCASGQNCGTLPDRINRMLVARIPAIPITDV
jgi:hypothetical protein